MEKLKVEYIDPYSLLAYEHNAKKHTDEQIAQIEKSIKDFGMNDPIGVWKSNIVIEGHGRLQACLNLGIAEVPIVRLDHLTNEQRRAYCLVHNQLTMNTGWDKEQLGFELADIDLDLSDFGLEIPEIEIEPDENERERTADAYNLPEVDLSRTAGKWQMPIIHATNHVPSDLISFNYVLNTKQYEKGVHFYIDDYQFERIWNTPYKYILKLAPYDCVLTPDFSLYTEMPLAMQMWNVYRSKLIGQILQDSGIEVIPTLQWCGPDTFEWCFEGIEKGGTVSVSTIGVKREESASKIWFDGMDEAIKQLEPSHVIVYGGDIGYKFPCDVTYIENHNTERMQ